MAFIVLNVAACRDGAPASAPRLTTPAAPQAPVASAVVASTAPIQTAVPASAVLEAPAVIVRDQFGVGMRDVSVTFAISGGGGAISNAKVKTDAYGLASCARWIISPVPGQNTVVASVDGIAAIRAVVFTAIGLLVPTDTAAYLLSSMGGKPLPVTYSDGSGSWTYIGGRIVLAPGGTWTQLYMVARSDASGIVTVDSSAISRGPYVRNALTIQFYGNGSLASWYMTGTINGNLLNVRYFDPIDFDDEGYVRAGSPGYD